METTTIMAHNGRPCDPPVIGTTHGLIAFEPNPAGGPLWLADCTPEQVEDLQPFAHFFLFQEDTHIPKIEKGTIPDQTWSRVGIAEWALEELDVTIEMKRKADMLNDLQAAIAAVVARAEAEKAEKAALPPFVAPEETTPEAPAPETPAEPPLVVD